MMRTKHLMWAFVALNACTVKLDAGSARITCKTSSECPESMVCKENLGLCVIVDGSDVAAPVVTAAQVVPALATAGTTLSLALSTDEPLAVDPIVSFGVNSVFAVTEVSASRQDFLLTYTVRGTESAGGQALQARLIDAAGNEASLVVASFALDFIAPRLGAAAWSLEGAKRRARVGDEAFFSGRVDGDASLVRAALFAEDVEVRDVTSAFSLSDAGDGLGLALQGSVVLDAPELRDGDRIAVGFALSDAAGNVTNVSATRGPALDFDTTPPSGTLTLPDTSDSTTITAFVSAVDAAAMTLSGDLVYPTGWLAPVLPAVSVLLTSGNGTKTITATFRDEAGNESTTAAQVVELELPPGPGAGGQSCNLHSECDSLQCRCVGASCANRRCASSETCGPCRTVDMTGACVGFVGTEQVDTLDCLGNKVCGAGGACLTKRGAACDAPAECVTSFCECANGACSAKLCADADCAFCKVGQTCATNRNNDVTCDAGRVCRVGACVVRDPGTCSASCPGGFNTTCPPAFYTSDMCNSAQGFSKAMVGSCPPSGSCSGSIGCQCF